MRTSYIFLFVLFLNMPIFADGQDWMTFNDTLVYYYQSELDEKFYTLRKEDVIVTEEDSSVLFTDNFIHIEKPEIGPVYWYHCYNGSVLGKQFQYLSDTIVINDSIFFYPNLELGESRIFVNFDSIKHTAITDTVLFGVSDSVKYYKVTDGKQFILSKHFGFVEIPELYPECNNSFELVGIEGIVGQSFNKHNEIFNFEIGDIFIYKEYYRYYIGDSEFAYHSEKVEMHVLSKFVIDGLYYYQVMSEGGSEYYPVYPLIYEDNNLFDYPGEKIEYCRTNDLYNGDGGYIDEFLIENEKYVSSHLGHEYLISPEGNLVQAIGIRTLEDDYERFGEYTYLYDFPGIYDLNYKESEIEEVYTTSYEPYETFAIYEEGLGLRYFYWEGGFNNEYSKSLIALIREGDTLGYYDLSLTENEILKFDFYPNPVSETISFESNYTEVKIIDLTGKTIITEKNSTQNINVSTLPNGIYLIEGVDLNGVIRYGKFYKQ